MKMVFKMMTNLQNKIIEILRKEKALTTKKIAVIIYKKEPLDEYHRKVVYNELQRLERKGHLTSELINPTGVATMFGRQYTYKVSTSREWRLK